MIKEFEQKCTKLDHMKSASVNKIDSDAIKCIHFELQNGEKFASGTNPQPLNGQGIHLLKSTQPKMSKKQFIALEVPIEEKENTFEVKQSNVDLIIKLLNDLDSSKKPKPVKKEPK
jgi:hypothetical protein